MRGLKEGMLGLALVGGCAALPTTAGAVASFSIGTTGSVFFGADYAGYVGGTSYTPPGEGINWDGDDAGEPEGRDGTVTGAGEISAKYCFALSTDCYGAAAEGNLTTTGSARYGSTFRDTTVESTGAPVLAEDLPYVSPLPVLFGDIAYFKNVHEGFASGPTGEVESRTRNTILTTTLANPESSVDALVVDLMFDFAADISFPDLQDPLTEFASGSTSFEVMTCRLLNGDGRECVSRGTVGALEDTDGFAVSDAGTYPFTFSVDPGESWELMLIQETYGYARSSVGPVPVPAALPMLGAAVAGLGFVARRRAKARG